MDSLTVLNERLKSIEDRLGNSSVIQNSSVTSTIEKLERILKEKKYGFLLSLNKEDIAHLDKKKIEIEEKDVKDKTVAIYYATEKLKKYCQDLEQVDIMSKKIFDSEVFVKVPSLMKELNKIQSEVEKSFEDVLSYCEEVKTMKMELIEVIKVLTARVSKLETKEN
uniref:Tubulin-specific chaperone A n=1 Tax=Strongyloides stercoralis TaxID=6248 RepID=A0A0K0DUA2_STRER